MNNNNYNYHIYKFPFLGILGIALVALKLMGKLDWSWWWITLPFWLPFAALLIGVAVFLVVGAAFDLMRNDRGRR